MRVVELTHMYAYKHTYIQRERERERERGISPTGVMPTLAFFDDV